VRDTVAPESPSTFWSQGDASFNKKGSESSVWRRLDPSILEGINNHDASWASADGLMDRSSEVAVEMEPR